MKTKFMSLCIGLGILLGATAAWAATGPATQAIEKPVRQIVAVLEDPTYKNGARYDEQRAKIIAITTPYFDFPTIAQATISRSNWAKFTATQKTEFTNTFTAFVSNLYADQLQANYGGEQLQFIDEQSKSPTKAYVKSIVMGLNNVKTPVDYSLWLKDGRWRIYNVFVEGTSLLGNYRNEFDRVLVNQSPDDLIKILKDKIAQQKIKSTGKK